MCGCSDGYYADGITCKDCFAITINDDPSIELANPEHVDGKCDCAETARWDSDLNKCISCADGEYWNNE